MHTESTATATTTPTITPNRANLTDRRRQIGAFIAGARAATEAAQAQYLERTRNDLEKLEALQAYADGAEAPELARQIAAVADENEPCNYHAPAAGPGLCWHCDAHREFLRLTDEIGTYCSIVDHVYIEAVGDCCQGPLDLPDLLSEYAGFLGGRLIDAQHARLEGEAAAAAYLAKPAAAPVAPRVRVVVP